MADTAKGTDKSFGSKVLSVANLWGLLKRWNNPQGVDGGDPGKLQAVVFFMFLIAFMAWYANIYLTLKIGKRLKEAMDNADQMYEYEQVYEKSPVTKVANGASFSRDSYLIHVIILSIAFGFAFVVSLVMWRLKLPYTSLLGNKSTFKLWMHTFTFFITLTWITAIVMFFKSNNEYRNRTRKIKAVSNDITDNIIADVDFLNMLMELPLHRVKINPNALNQSSYYVDNMGFAPGDEKKAAKYLYTASLYWWMIQNVPSDKDLRDKLFELFDPTTVLFKKLASRFGKDGGYINLMTSKDKFTGELTDQVIDFVKENLRCEDPVECQGNLAFAEFYDQNKATIMEHYNIMTGGLGDLVTATEQFEGSFDSGKQLYWAMTWLNGWIPALTIMFIGIAIIEAKSDCPMWKAFGGTVIALGMLPIILRRYVF
jgi:hypothetical protein